MTLVGYNSLLLSTPAPGASGDDDSASGLYSSGFELPSNPVENQIFELLKKIEIPEVVLEKIDLTAESNADDFGNRSIGILTLDGSTGLHIPFSSVLAAINYRALRSNDKIIATAEGVTTVEITISQSMTWETDSQTLFSPSTGGYSHDGSFIDDERYAVHAVLAGREFDARTIIKYVNSRWYLQYQPLDRWLTSEPPHEVGLHWNLDSSQSDFDVYIDKLTRTGETTATEMTNAKIFEFGSLIIPVANSGDAGPLLSLRQGDKILLAAANGVNVLYTITDTSDNIASFSSTNSIGGHTIPAVIIAGEDYSRTGVIADGVEYTVYVIRNRFVPRGSTLKSDGLQWEEVFVEGSIQDNPSGTPTNTKTLAIGSDSGDQQASISEVLKLAPFPVDRHGTTLPTDNLIENQTFLLTAPLSDAETYTDKHSRVNFTTYTNNVIGIFSGTLQINFDTQAEGQKYLDLGTDDKIVAIRQDDDETVTFTLSQSPTYNSISKAVEVPSTGYTKTGDNFVQGRSYDVYAFVVKDRKPGDIFATNTVYWQNIYSRELGKTETLFEGSVNFGSGNNSKKWIDVQLDEDIDEYDLIFFEVFNDTYDRIGTGNFLSESFIDFTTYRTSGAYWYNESSVDKFMWAMSGTSTGVKFIIARKDTTKDNLSVSTDVDSFGTKNITIKGIRVRI